MSASYEVRGAVAVITLNNPPVNGLGLSTRVALAAGIEQAVGDPGVKAIVVTGAGKAFSGGADIREFGSPKAIQEPNLLSLIRLCENTPKPVVAAIHTVCMGGGLSWPWVATTEWCPRRANCAAGSEAGLGAGRRWHAAPAARLGRRNRLEHDRQGRSGEERSARRLARATAV